MPGVGPKYLEDHLNMHNITAAPGAQASEQYQVSGGTLHLAVHSSLNCSPPYPVITHDITIK